MLKFEISPKLAFVISGVYNLIFLAFAVYKGIILYLIKIAMEDTFVGGNTSDISITLWFLISSILALTSFLFFYFIKIKDLKSQKIILSGITILWLFFSILQLFLFKDYFYLAIFTTIQIISCYLEHKNLKNKIIKNLKDKGLSEKEIYLLQLLAGIKKNKDGGPARTRTWDQYIMSVLL